MSTSDEPTPWEDINPPIASARRPALPSTCSVRTDARTVFRNELTACLTLTAPVGMTEEAKRDWFAVAWDTLKHVPPNILATAAKKARLRADHPSKIVPLIADEAEKLMARERSIEQASPSGDIVLLPASQRHISSRDRTNFKAADWDELNIWLEKMGSPRRYSPTGEPYEIAA